MTDLEKIDTHRNEIHYLNMLITKNYKCIADIKRECNHEWKLVSVLPYHNVRFLHCNLCECDKSEKINSDSFLGL